MHRKHKISSSGEAASPSLAMASSEALAVISGTASSMNEDAVKKPGGVGIPLAWRPSLKPLPPLNLGDIKRRMKEAGLVDHEFSAKSLQEDELLVVAGLHPALNTYEGPLDRFSRLRIMMNRAAVRKFIREDVPTLPTSLGLRPILPDDIPPTLVLPSSTPSSSRPRSSTPSASMPSSSPPPTPSDAPPLSPLPPPVEALSSSLKRPRREETPSEDTLRSYEGTPNLVFPAPVLTPRLDPRAGSFNMRQAVHRSDIKTLSTCSMQGLGSFILAQSSTEITRKELSDTRAQLDCLKNQYREDDARSRECEAKLVDELEDLKNQVVEKDGHIAAVTVENEVVRASTVQAYTRGREEGASSGVAAFKSSPEYAVELSRHGSSFYIDGFATCLDQFRNLCNHPPGFDLSFVNVRANGFGRTRGEGPSDD
ncbi:hypothetical protein Salat_0637700 [Sesamum alatum]|uniref:Uncharacterized protein n=1 Tax=Sesamum alatum TaxID=300844 RepID=A0AAE2CUB6_9LAMI|nr:hypothetical protein Salat_0637700 [Sesamum alatum]